jgi:peptidoglycan/xylan/chitin deacetylase (PgdA/CDA1 family)
MAASLAHAGARAWRHAAEVRAEAQDLLGGRYPRFVTAARGATLHGEVPVFVFHSLEPASFEEQLGFLAANGYRTVDCDGFLRILSGEAPADRTVMLTIDDGRASVWTWGFPLLKKYGMTAVVFLIPGQIPEAGAVSPNLDDVREGRVPAGSLASRDPELMSWAEVEAMAASGLVDFQSHTLHHHKVPTGPRVTDFVRVGGPPPYDVPLPAGSATEDRRQLVGTPIFEADSLMSGRTVFVPDADLVASCREAAANGAQGDELRDIVRKYGERHGALGRLEGEAATSRRVLENLRASRRAIEERLGRPARHLCYPYTIGSALSVRLSREAGYASNFWGVLPGRRSNRPGDDPFHAVRLKNDFIHRLPGQGRRPLGSILIDKVRRRASGGAVY